MSRSSLFLAERPRRGSDWGLRSSRSRSSSLLLEGDCGLLSLRLRRLLAICSKHEALVRSLS